MNDTNRTKIKRDNCTVIADKIKSPNDNIHIYEQLPSTRVTMVRNSKGELCSVQTIHIHKKGYTIEYIEGRKAIVILTDGSVGTYYSNKHFDMQTAHDIAVYRAIINSNKRKINKLLKGID